MSALAFSIVDFGEFLAAASAANSWVLSRFDWLINLAAFASVLIVAAVFISPLGGVRIGGEKAKPILSRWNWFSIALCTTIATGILFWGAAEPMFHVNNPPAFSGVDARSADAGAFALSSMFLHWTITPYALYAIPALAFALAHYNLGRPYSLSGPLKLFLGRQADGGVGAAVDALALYALVAGVAASLGAGVMTLAGGVDAMTGVSDTPYLRFVITGIIVAVFVASSVSGIQRGIKILSDINIKVFFALALFVLIAGPTGSILLLGAEGALSYIADFIPRSLALGDRASDPWTRDWTVFYFANWLAWAPITALFLGRISVGYTVREFVAFNLLAPAAFGALWMTVFGGAAIVVDRNSGGALTAALNQDGPEAVIYALFSALPLAALATVTLIGATFISFVTAMDSNTHSIAGVCLKPEAPGGLSGRPAMAVKIFWGVLVGAVAFVMTSVSGIDGVRMLSNLGGLPGLFILIGMMAVLIFMMTTKLDDIRAAKHEGDLP